MRIFAGVPFLVIVLSALPEVAPAWAGETSPCDLRTELEAMLTDGSAFAPAPSPERGLLATALLAAEGSGGMDDLTKKTQNPVSDLISLPLQDNVTFGVGPEDKVQSTLNIQPVIPISLNEDWNVITRTILPLVYQPSLGPGTGSKFGLGDTTLTAFLSPSKPGEWIWGVGPVLLLPTSTHGRLGAGQWGAGISGVVLRMEGPWVFGVLSNNVWSFEGDVNTFLFQYFINYNLGDGWYVLSAPIITANWKADSDNTWTIPFGIGGGRVFKAGKLPLNVQVGVYYNAERPEGWGDWTLRLQVQFLFPK